MGALDAIGNTPLVELDRIRPSNGARIVAKLEWANPTGSMKDRMARSAIRAAARDGRLPPGGKVLEYTAGSTGISLAFACAALGYGLHIVYSEAFSDEKRRTMRAYGATVEDMPRIGPSGSNRIEGIGIGFVPPLWEPEQVDRVEAVSADEAIAMAKRLAREEGLFAGTSSGANVVAALRVAERLGPAATAATILCDSGLRYLSTIYREA